MKINKLAQSIGLIVISVATTTSYAYASDSYAEKSGQRLTQIGDKIFTSLTDKHSYDEVIHPVSLFDYNKASSAYEDAYLNGRLDVKDGNQDKTSYALDLGTNYEKVSSTADTNLKYETDASISIKRDGNSDAERQENYNANGSITYDNYFNPEASDLFWYGKGELNIQDEAPEDYAGIKNPRVTLTGGIGYGRVINVTPMARAIRVIEALVERGIINSTPSKSVYQNVATIIEKEPEYKSKYGLADYKQQWIKDIEVELGTNLGAAGIIKVSDVLVDEKISTRKYGWDVRAGIGAVVTDFDGENSKPVFEAEGNYYYPLSNRTQFSNETRFKTILDDNNNSYNITNDMGLTYEVSDRVDWINSWKIGYTNNENANNVTTNDISTTYRYYVSNAIGFDTTLFAKHTEDDVDGNGNDKVDTGLLMGINYRLK